MRELVLTRSSTEYPAQDLRLRSLSAATELFQTPTCSARRSLSTNSNPTSWTVRTDSTTAAVLRLRLTNVPGWHATIDGRPLELQPFSSVMLQARDSQWSPHGAIGLLANLVHLRVGDRRVGRGHPLGGGSSRLDPSTEYSCP